MSEPPLLTTPRSGYGGRGYKIPGRDRAYPGVTTVLNQVAKTQLMQWTADMVAAYAVTHIAELMARTEEVGWGFLRFVWSKERDLDDPVRNQHNTFRNDRAELGTNIHAWAEAEVGGGVYPAIDSVETEQMIEALDQFISEHTILPHHSEFTVVNDTLGYAGTGDADWSVGCDHGGRPCLPDSDVQLVRSLVDIKSSRHTWREHGHQIAALGHAEKLMINVPEGTEGAVRAEKTHKGKKIRSWWLEEDMPKFDDFALLHIRPRDLDAGGNIIEPFCTLKQVRRIDQHWRGFQAALVLAEVEKELKADAKLFGANMAFDEELV